MSIRTDVRNAFVRRERREARKTLKRALDLFGPEGENWIKFKMTDHNGSFCALGAVEKADGPGQQVATTVLSAVMATKPNLKKADFNKTYRITSRNDNGTTKFKDVKAYFQKAIQYLAD